MTRRLRLLLLCILMLTLTGCAPASRASKAIDAIGTVTMASQQKIEKAESLIEKLDASQRSEVTNLDILTQARAEFDRQEALITAAMDAAAAMDASPEGLAAAVSEARQAYDAAIALDVTGLLEETEALLLAAEAQLKQMETESINLTNKLLELYAAGNYSGIEPSAAPYILNLPNGEAKQQLGTVVVRALCAQAEVLYSKGNCMDAMSLLYRCEDYVNYCEEDPLAKARELMTRYIREKSVNAPASGTVLDRAHHAGRNIFTVTAGPLDTCLKLELVDDASKYVMLYIRSGETAKVHLFNGTYRIKYAAGPIWYDTVNLFGPEATYLTLEETVELAGYTTPTHIYWHTVNCTLESGYGEEFGLQNMKPEEF